MYEMNDFLDQLANCIYLSMTNEFFGQLNFQRHDQEKPEHRFINAAGSSKIFTRAEYGSG